MPLYDWVKKSFQKTFSDQKKQEHTFLSAIQSLEGAMPGKKQATFNKLINNAIINIKKGNKGHNDDFRDIPNVLMPLAEIMIANKLKWPASIIEGLKSEDPLVNKEALKARWFFLGSNVWIDPVDFTHNIMPKLSLKMRHAVVRKLSYSLIGFEKKAETFFDSFTHLYGYKINVPILVACSEDFIFSKILEHKIVLSAKIVNNLYEIKPNVAITYLQLANKKSKENEKYKKATEVRIYEYESILPKLIPAHPELFVELYELMPDKRLKLSKSKSIQFLNTLKDVLVEKPKIYLKLLPLDTVTEHLNRDLFEKMYEKLFPEEKLEFQLEEMIGYLKYYEFGDKYELLRSKYQKLYGLDFPAEKYLELTSSISLAIILPNKELDTLAHSLMEKNKDNPDLFKFVMSYLSPESLFIAMRESIILMSNTLDREMAFISLITSCYIYKNLKVLYDIFEFYYTDHMHERMCVLGSILAKMSELDFKDLNEEHWNVLLKIIKAVHGKSEFFNVYGYSGEWILKHALRHYIVDSVKNSKVIREIVELLLIIKVVVNSPDWNILKGKRYEREAFLLLLEMVPDYYPAGDPVWSNMNRQVSIALDVLEMILEYNKRQGYSTKIFQKARKNEDKKLKIDNYPWLMAIVEQQLQSNDREQFNRRRRLREIVVSSFPEFKIPNGAENVPLNVSDFESGEALKCLRDSPWEILSDWEDYLHIVACLLSYGGEVRKRKGFKAARRFVYATKWYNIIPIKFVEKSIAHMTKEGYCIVLGLLLDGDSLVKTLFSSPHIQNELNVLKSKKCEKKYNMVSMIIEAFMYAHPPVNLDEYLHFCHSEWLKYTEPALVSLSNYISAERMSDFALKWAESKMKSVKKQGIRLYTRTARIDDVVQFLKDSYASETNPGVRSVITKIILQLFVEVPNARTWLMVEFAIKNLTADNLVNLSNLLTNVQTIQKEYLSKYVAEFLDVTESLASSGMNKRSKYNIISSLIENLDPFITSNLSAPVVMRILNRYFYESESIDVSCVTQRFAIVSYLLPSEEDFEERMETIIDKIKTVIKQYDTPIPANWRYYPAKEMIYMFFKCLTTEFENDHPYNKKLLVLKRFREIFKTSFELNKALPSNMRIAFYFEYLQSNSPQEFGKGCVKCAHEYMDKLSEFFIHEIGECIINIINERCKSLTYRLSFIEELVRDRDRIACMIAIMVLNDLETSNCDERYDDIILHLKGVSDLSVKIYLDNHTCKVSQSEL